MCVPMYLVYKSHLRIYVPLNTLLKTHKSKTILNDKDTYVELQKPFTKVENRSNSYFYYNMIWKLTWKSTDYTC